MTNLPISGEFSVTATYKQVNKSLWATYHKGIDIVSGNKTIYSTCNGKVRVVGYDAKGWGQYVSIGDENGNKHIFCHLVKGSVKVKEGQKVTRTTVLGTMGATGNVTGVHLHYQINKIDTDKDVDPTPYLGIPNQKGKYNSKDYHIDQSETYKDDSLISSWAKDAVYKLKSLGIMTGDNNGNFNPTDKITREEAAVAIYNTCKSMNYTFNDNSYTLYQDHAKIASWAIDEVYTLKRWRLMVGDTSNKFNPKKSITRQECAVLFNNVYNTKVALKDVLLYKDHKDIATWATQSVYTLKECNIMVGYNNFFEPKAYITRQEVAVLIVNLMNSKESE